MFKTQIARCSIVAAVLFTFNVSFAAEPADGAKKQTAKPTTFIRLLRDAEKQPMALQTATARYVAASGEGDLVVDLIGVVHIADKKYYHQLNEQFEQYDALLYELVARPEDRVPMRDRGGDNMLSMLHEMMNVMLDLDSQMDRIDYTKDNFVHADLSPEEMAKTIRERGDDQITILLGVAADLLRQQNLERFRQQRQAADADTVPEELDLSSAFESLLDPGKMKRTMAEQLAEQDDPAAGIGRTLGQILIDDRNKAAIKVFQKELARGKNRIGIFFGAAHMPDFERRLTRDFGMKLTEVTWLTAWDLQTQQTSGFERLFRLLDEIE